MSRSNTHITHINSAYRNTEHTDPSKNHKNTFSSTCGFAKHLGCPLKFKNIPYTCVTYQIQFACKMSPRATFKICSISWPFSINSYNSQHE